MPTDLKSIPASFYWNSHVGLEISLGDELGAVHWIVLLLWALDS